MSNSVIDSFIQRTNGNRASAIALLRETIFYNNTGRWPTHLFRTWRQFDSDGKTCVWQEARPGQ